MARAKKEPQLQDFKYVDVRFTDQMGKSNGEWERIEKSAVPEWQQKVAFNYNCFATIQRFANKVREKGEAFIAPLYFDLDHAEDPSVSLADARKLVHFFLNELDVQESDMQIYFSGSKGFHILISYSVFGIQPSNNLHKIFKHIAGYLIHRLELTSLDMVVYTSARMLRLPNSVHQKTNLHKIELSKTELDTMTIEQIQELAKAPRRDLPFTDEQRKELIGLREKAAEFYKDKRGEYLEVAATANARHEKEEYHFTKGVPPVCVQDIMNGGWKKEGDRNQATVQLACYYKDAGHSKEETLKILEEWVVKHTSANSHYQKQQRIANTRSVVDAVYSKDNEYRFGCAFIRSLHGPKTPGSNEYERVACAGDLCPCVKRKKDTEEAPINLHLSQTGDADLTGKLIKTRVMIAGKKHTPYIVTKRIEYHCWGRDGCKKTHCPLYDIPSHTAYKDLGVQDRELIQMCGVGDDNIKGILKEISGIPSCYKYNVEQVETTNVEELLVIPMAEPDRVEENPSTGKYVLRRVYSVGGIDLSENKYYEITGYVFPHPKNQESTIIVKDATPMQDVVESFQLTDEIKSQLRSFQPENYTPEMIEQKLKTLCDDLTYNVTRIVERDETLLGVLLTYHSVLRFKVPWSSTAIRGWVEGKIVGDTGTGKSALIESIMNFVRLGQRVNAESTSRTGLTYKMEQSGASGAWYIVWGAWPLADRELIWIDEDTGITKDEYGEMTLARSDGKLEVKRAVTAETPCRVRAILSGNVPKGRRLADYGHGVESLKDIFNNEDIRRFDFAIFMRASDVGPEKYNAQLGFYPQKFTAEALKNNILFAWSRTPDDVVFAGDSIERILQVSTNLSKIYGNANDVPLVSPSDQRNKIARLAVALAALTHSVDESGERIVVWPGHVEFIEAYLQSIYNAPGCGLNYYARLAIREEEMTDERYERFTQEMRGLKTLKHDGKFYDFIKLFAQQNYLGVSDVEAMLAIEKEEAKAIVNLLTKMRMVVKTTGGFKKTPRFHAYVAKCFELGIFDQIDDEY